MAPERDRKVASNRLLSVEELVAADVLLSHPEMKRPAWLITPDGYNPKTRKGRARGFATAILHLAPSDLSGLNVCQFASDGCRASCLNTAGHGGIALDASGLNNVQRARINRTRLFRYNRSLFNLLLVRAIESHIRSAVKHGLVPVVRLNGTSDLPWERLRLNDGRTVLETFPGVQFYDYTKNPRRALEHASGSMPANYQLTFSRSEINDADVQSVLAAGGNVATVFSVCSHKVTCHCPLPETFDGRRVLNGDADDLRFLDPTGGHWVGLRESDSEPRTPVTHTAENSGG